ncbi:MAG: hypothetical protein ABI624_04390 [Casimicrobiaceae bacterium]
MTLTLLAGLPAVAADPPPVPAKAQPPAAPWPRAVNLSGAAVLVYQPQVVKWVDSQIDFRCAVAIKPAGARDETFGVVFATARTHVDKTTRTVVFDNLQITRSDFPTLADHGASYGAQLQQQFAAGIRSISLDRLKTSLAAAGSKPPTVEVQNVPPKVIVSYAPAILVPVDGAPVLRPVAGSAGFQRVINTRALIVKSASEPQFFLHVYDGWLMALSLDGPWSQPFIPPSGIDALAQKIAATGVVDLLDGGPKANPKPSLAQGIPAIYTSQVPAELVAFKGQPEFVPIVGTQLKWAANTANDVLLDSAANNYYALLAGRWFRSAALTGPWSFVGSNALPPDFAQIPAASLAGVVLPTVAGTPQARVAAIENAIPQTATIPLKDGPTFTPSFDGAPQFAPIAGTSLSYAPNAAVPVIQAAPNAYYAVTAGVWFTAAAATGPWTIATSVPAAIYTIPPSSPIFYATFVRIYGATSDTVFEGYTPGYLGALVAPTGNVVFGTGIAYAPWIGNAWYPPPSTYGVAAMPVYNAYVGYTYGFAMSLATPAWAEAFAGGAHFHPGYWGGYPCCGSASANVYRYWGRAAYSKSRAKNPDKSAAAKAAKIAKNASAAVPATVTGNPPAMMAKSAGPMTASAPAASPAAKAAPNATAMDAPGNNTSYISANQYYADLGQSGTWTPPAMNNAHYADASGNVYRKADSGWQQHSAAGWKAMPAPPPDVDAEASARDRADAAGQQAGSYSMSNTTRFSGDPGDGWSRRDAGNGGYSRTLGGDGGISAERWAYNDAVLNNEFDIAANGGWWSQGVYIGGVGWGGRYGGP